MAARLQGVVDVQRRERAEAEAGALREQLAAMTSRAEAMMKVLEGLSPDDLAMKDELRAATAMIQRLLEEVWGYDPFATTNTIEVFVSNLRRKLETGGEPRLLHTIRGAGYVLRA